LISFLFLEFLVPQLSVTIHLLFENILTITELNKAMREEENLLIHELGESIGRFKDMEPGSDESDNHYQDLVDDLDKKYIAKRDQIDYTCPALADKTNTYKN